MPTGPPTFVSILRRVFALLAFTCCQHAPAAETTSYRWFRVEEHEGRITACEPLSTTPSPRWAREVATTAAAWQPVPADRPTFQGPVPFVLPPADPGETFHPHNHQPSVTWLANGDLLAIWYTTREEQGTELTVLASRLRRGATEWDPSSVFFKADNHNMHGAAIFHDGKGTIHHLNGIAPAGARGWDKLAMLHRSSRDHGVTWSDPHPACPVYQQRHQVISGTFLTADGELVQPCDAVPGGAGGTALQISRDLGHTWSDPGESCAAPRFIAGGSGRGTIAGIHAGVVPLTDGRLLAFGRGDPIDRRMPMSISADTGKTWTYAASEFPPIGGGQRLVLLRLREGPLLFASFTATSREQHKDPGLIFPTAAGGSFRGHGLFAALSWDEGKTWPTRKLLTPGSGEHDGGAWTGKFTATPERAEHAGYLAATQSPDGMVHLLSSRLHYRFNLAWLRQAAAAPPSPPAPAR
jgi:hypothetical protein